MNLAVSVIIPVYNMAAYVGKCIESVLVQTLQDIEVIVVNDGSTDNSLKIINDYARRDKRIRVIDKPNAGLGSTYNAGQMIARGKYIYFLDSDDWMDRNCLKTLYTIAEKEQVEVVKSWGFISERKGQHWEKRTIPKDKCNKVITDMLSIPEFVSGHVAQWSCLYRRDFLINNHIWCLELPPKMSPDINFMYHVWVKCNRLYVVSESFVHYRTDNENSAKNTGSAMSFRLMRAHLGTRATMANLHLKKDYWFVKTRVEFVHLMYELISKRCRQNRGTYIKAMSKIFRENLKHGLVNFGGWKTEDKVKYWVIAHAPWLYRLNDKIQFWTTSINRASGEMIYRRFFGLYKRVCKQGNEKTYLFGCLIKKKSLKEKHEESN